MLFWVVCEQGRAGNLIGRIVRVLKIKYSGQFKINFRGIPTNVHELDSTLSDRFVFF